MGLCHPARTTLMVGNFNTNRDNTEMGALEQRFVHMEAEIGAAMRIAKPRLEGDIYPLSINFSEVLVTTSGRRWEQVLRDWVTLPAEDDDKIYLDNVRNWHLSG